MFKKSILLGIVVLLLVSITGCSLLQKAVSVASTIDKGSVEGNVYKNEFFGMSVTIPEEWVIASEEEMEQITAAGNELIAGEDKAKKAMMDLASLKTVYLLSSNNQELVNNASFMALAENLAFNKEVKSGKDYLEATQEGLKTLLSQIPYEFGKEIYKQTIGGKEFYVMETTVDLSAMKVTQTYYAAVMNKYALVFITTSMDEDNNKAIEEILENIEFN